MDLVNRKKIVEELFDQIDTKEPTFENSENCYKKLDENESFSEGSSEKTLDCVVKNFVKILNLDTSLLQINQENYEKFIQEKEVLPFLSIRELFLMSIENTLQDYLTLSESLTQEAYCLSGICIVLIYEIHKRKNLPSVDFPSIVIGKTNKQKWIVSVILEMIDLILGSIYDKVSEELSPIIAIILFPKILQLITIFGNNLVSASNRLLN